ncbi:MAG TPA: sigma-70 family RNA polymerase sigma factor [Thermoanaerobaculia bacterium]|nr:sigma-70 family RNA polymerase sigma factor [Thermoanaerobaculia bacterium]
MDLEETLQALASPLLRYCLGRTGDRALAEEVAQEALAALALRWQRRGPPESPPGFAFAIARRRAFRALARRRLLLPLLALGASSNGHDPLADPERRTLERDTLARTLAAIRALPARDREALLIVAAGELPGAEAARLLGLSRSALKMRVLRARRRLCDLLEENDARPDPR